MRKHSMMGSSKYEFSPEHFDIDVQMNAERLESKRQRIKEQLLLEFQSDPTRIDETLFIIIELLKEIKQEHSL